MVAETRYAKSGDVFVAYQVSGQASPAPDLVVAPGFFSHLEHDWENPRFARVNHALGSFSRLICFDKRGTGLSDRSVGIPHLEERIDDIRAVLDAAGSRRAFLCGTSEGGPMSLLFAATYPERVAGLILVGSYAHAASAVVVYSDPAVAERAVEESWGTGKGLEDFAPSVAGEASFREWWGRRQRLGASPSGVINLMRMNREIDVRHILPAIRVPTLVIHRRDDVRVRASAGRYLADNIPDADLSSYRGRITCSGSTTTVGLRRRFAILSAVRRKRWRPTACWRRCCSPTSSIPRARPQPAATATGAQRSRRTIRWCGRSFSAIAAAK